MDLLFYSWFAPKCESPLRTVSIWVYCFSLFDLLPSVRVRCGLYPHGLTTWAACVCDVLVPCERVHCGLYHMGLLFYSFGFFSCVRVCCEQYPHVECFLPCVSLLQGLHVRI